jgi:hypothetical protein
MCETQSSYFRLSHATSSAATDAISPGSSASHGSPAVTAKAGIGGGDPKDGACVLDPATNKSPPGRVRSSGRVAGYGKPGKHLCFPPVVARCCQGALWQVSPRLPSVAFLTRQDPLHAFHAQERGIFAYKDCKGGSGKERPGYSFVYTTGVAAERKAKLENFSISYLLIHLIAIPFVFIGSCI